MPGKGKTVGELNGKWAFLFRLTQLTFPLVAAACVWLCWTLPGDLAALREWRKSSEITLKDCETLKADVAALVAWRDTIVPERTRALETNIKDINDLREKVDGYAADSRAQYDRLNDKIEAKSFQTQQKLDHLLELITKKE